MKRGFKIKQKTFFEIFDELLVAKKRLRHESAPLILSSFSSANVR